MIGSLIIFIGSILLGFFLLGVIIPISFTVGDIISDKIGCFLCHLIDRKELIGRN